MVSHLNLDNELGYEIGSFACAETSVEVYKFSQSYQVGVTMHVWACPF